MRHPIFSRCLAEVRRQRAGSVRTRESVCRRIAVVVIRQLILTIGNGPKDAVSIRCIGFLLLFRELLSWVISGNLPIASVNCISPRPVRSNMHHTPDQACFVHLSALVASSHLLRHCC